MGGTGKQAKIEMSDLLGMLVELDNKGMSAADVGANGLRSATSKGFFDWFRTQDADVLCVQETKAQEHQLTGQTFLPEGYKAWTGKGLAEENQDDVRGVVHIKRAVGVPPAKREEVEAGRPRTAREIEAALGHERSGDKEHWGWNWSSVKEGLEVLFHAGEVTSAGGSLIFYTFTTYMQKYLVNTAGMSAKTASAVMTFCVLAGSAICWL